MEPVKTRNFALMLALIMAFAACTPSNNNNNLSSNSNSPTSSSQDTDTPPANNSGPDNSEPVTENGAITNIDNPANPAEDENELCHCGEHYVNEELRNPTPPLYIHEIIPEWHYPPTDFPKEEHDKLLSEFVSKYETVHTTTFIQWETEWYDTLIIWTDTPLRDFSFVSLDHQDNNDERGAFYIKEKLLTVDELLPNDAVVLNVAFEHYLIPRGGLVFTDESGVRRRVFISESMRGGCFPRYNLKFYEDSFSDWADWID